MIKLPVGEIADFSEFLVGDSKNIWDHVPIETVGRFFSLLKLTPSQQFIRYIQTNATVQQ